jgi:hypothetical protein
LQHAQYKSTARQAELMKSEGEEINGIYDTHCTEI